MNSFFFWLIKSSISLAVLFILFKLIKQNDKTLVVNRFLLLGILVFSALLPLLNIQFFTREIQIKPSEIFREFLATPVLNPTVPFSENIADQEVVSVGQNPVLFIYIGFVFILFARIVFSVITVLQIIQKAEKQAFRKLVLALVNEVIQPFSFINKIVLSKKDYNENKDIVVAHEHAHIKQLHAIDLVVCELFTLLHFFNPFMWLLRRELKLIHEYQADQAVLQKGIDAKKYQLLVLEKAVGERRFALANQFTQKPILKRLKMMQKKNRKQGAALKLILFIPVLIVLLQAFARPELLTKSSDFIPVKYTENETEKWLSKWTAENIGKGFFQPALESPDAPKKPNNVLVILMNRNDEYLIEDEHRQKEEIKSIVKNYLLGINPNGKNGPDYQEKEIPFVGKMKVSKGMIVYKHDLASSKERIDFTLRNIGEACLEVRKEKAQILFGKDYFDLDDEKQQVVNEVVPIWFSCDLPKSPTPNVWLPFDEKPSPPEPLNIIFKNSGEVFVQNHKFNSMAEFEENLKYWNNDLEEYNKDRKSKGYFRAHVTYEDFSQQTMKEIDYMLYRNKVHVERIVQTTSNAKQQNLSLENEKVAARKDQALAKAEKLMLDNDSTKIELEEEQERAIKDQSVFKKIKLYSSKPVLESPPSFISVTLEKNRNIICQNNNFDYDEFDLFLKETYKGFKRKLDLSAEVKWDTAVGYQGIHKLAKILDKRGFENVDFKPFNEDGFLPPLDQQQKVPKVLALIKDDKFVPLNSKSVFSQPKVIIRVTSEGDFYFGELIYPKNEEGKNDIAWNNPLNKSELKEKVEERQRQFNKLKQNSDLPLKELIADVFIDKDAPKNSVSELKEILRETQMVYVNVQ